MPRMHRGGPRGPALPAVRRLRAEGVDQPHNVRFADSLGPVTPASPRSPTSSQKRERPRPLVHRRHSRPTRACRKLGPACLTAPTCGLWRPWRRSIIFRGPGWMAGAAGGSWQTPRAVPVRESAVAAFVTQQLKRGGNKSEHELDADKAGLYKRSTKVVIDNAVFTGEEKSPYVEGRCKGTLKGGHQPMYSPRYYYHPKNGRVLKSECECETRGSAICKHVVALLEAVRRSKGEHGGDEPDPSGSESDSSRPTASPSDSSRPTASPAGSATPVASTVGCVDHQSDLSSSLVKTRPHSKLISRTVSGAARAGDLSATAGAQASHRSRPTRPISPAAAAGHQTVPARNISVPMSGGFCDRECAEKADSSEKAGGGRGKRGAGQSNARARQQSRQEQGGRRIVRALECALLTRLFCWQSRQSSGAVQGSPEPRWAHPADQVDKISQDRPKRR